MVLVTITKNSLRTSEVSPSLHPCCSLPRDLNIGTGGMYGPYSKPEDQEAASLVPHGDRRWCVHEVSFHHH
jgi:hypothetical protein